MSTVGKQVQGKLRRRSSKEEAECKFGRRRSVLVDTASQIRTTPDVQRNVEDQHLTLIKLFGGLKNETANASDGGVIASAPSFAQPQEVIVEALGHVETSPTGIPIDVLTVRHAVGYEDIDITTNLGAKVLKQRIEDAAKAACKEIDTLYPN